jgi:signal transduction histidine kinase
MALGMDGASMAAEVFVNASLLWRDAALQEPLSRSWNMPRWWLLPAETLHEGSNTLWIGVVGVSELSPGLGQLRLGPADQVQAISERKHWRQRTVYELTAGMAMAAGGLFAVVWLLRRREQAFGWYALVSLSWAAYLSTVLVTSPWPLPSTLAMSRLNIVLFVVYVLAFCKFTWRFGSQHVPRTERMLQGLATTAVLATVVAPNSATHAVFTLVWVGFALAMMACCLQFQWHAWRPRPGGRDPQHMLLALCWLLIIVVGVHDLLLVTQGWQAHENWGAIMGPVATLLMALLVGGRLAAGMRRIEGFNDELETHVAKTRRELEQVLAREHVQALEHAKLQERVQIAHDLHDGLGGSLVRGLALVEQSPNGLPHSLVLSLFKHMRDDLRQVIDHGASAGVNVPPTPLQWAAPLRHRSSRILDELNVLSHWRVAPQWPAGHLPNTLQCMSLNRLLEESLSNVIKHSRARSLWVEIDTEPPLQPGCLRLRITDDGMGFDVEAVRRAGLSVGMRSMAARAQRIGAQLEVQSGPDGTRVEVVLQLPEVMAPATYTGRMNVFEP